MAPSSKTTEDEQALREIGQDTLGRSGDAFKVENGLIRAEWGETFSLLLGNYHPWKAEELAGGREITTYHKTNLSQIQSLQRSGVFGLVPRLLEEFERSLDRAQPSAEQTPHPFCSEERGNGERVR